MFNLEQAIAEWRQQMLAAGIHMPATLEELEGHLREGIRRQMESGKDESPAFAMAVEEMGQPGMLKAEFQRARGFMGWLGEDGQARIARGLSLLWATIFATGAIDLIWQFASQLMTGFQLNLFTLLMLSIYVRGLAASIRLFKGNVRDQRLLWLLAILSTLCHIWFLTPNSPARPFQPSWLFCGSMLLGFASVWYLRPARKTGLANR